MNLTIFDLDSTLLAGDSDYAWGQFLVEKGLVNADHYAQENDRFYQEYQAKTLDIYEYQRFVLKPLMQIEDADRAKWHREFIDTFIQPMRLDKADALIKEHKDKGDELLIITATNRLIAGPIGPLLGIDNVLATEAEVVNGRLSGHLCGTPCFQEGKVARLKEWLSKKALQPDVTTFYSDSINDLPLLEFADKAIAVDPDDKLRSHAINQGWPVISLR